jgi:hypothetical protein
MPDACRLPPEGGPRVNFRDGRVEAPRDYRLARNADLPAAAGDEPGLWFVPGVAGEALEEMAGTTRPARVLLFFTDRGPDSQRSASEPVAATTFLADWLRSQGIDARPVCVLGPGEDLHVRDKGGSRSLLPAAAQRIDEALRAVAEEFPDARCDLYAAAGIPELSHVAQASADFRFPNVRYCHSSEDKDAALIPVVPFTAVQALQARSQARQLVRRGEFEAAGVLAGRFAAAGEPGDWVRAVRMAATYFRGYRTHAKKQAEGAPLPCTAAFLLGIVGEKNVLAIHVALRAEAALRRIDVLAAASLTATFYDVAKADRDRLARDDARRPAVVAALQNYDTALNDWHQDLLPTARAHRPAELRNRVIHGLPDEEEVKEVIEVFTHPRIDLWRREDGTLSFLAAGTRAAAVFDALGVPDAGGRYEALAAALAADIEGCPLAAPDGGRP